MCACVEPKHVHTSAFSPTGTITADGFTAYDLARLESYSRNLVDYHLIMDLVPTVSKLYYMNSLPVTLSHVQAAILLMIGLQSRSVKEVDAVLDIPGTQVPWGGGLVAAIAAMMMMMMMMIIIIHVCACID